MNIPATVATCKRCQGSLRLATMRHVDKSLRLATMRHVDVVVCDACQRFTYPPVVVKQWVADQRADLPALTLIGSSY